MHASAHMHMRMARSRATLLACEALNANKSMSVLA